MIINPKFDQTSKASNSRVRHGGKKAAPDSKGVPLAYLAREIRGETHRGGRGKVVGIDNSVISRHGATKPHASAFRA